MQWIKEVEMVESVDDLKSSRSIRGTSGPDFELLDARLALALNKIIQNTRFKRERGQSGGTKGPKRMTVSFAEDRLPTLIYEYFRVTGANGSVEELCRPIYGCSSK